MIRGHKTESVDDDVCGICLEIPEKYGILLNCDHVYCFGIASILYLCNIRSALTRRKDCIYRWRTTIINEYDEEIFGPVSEVEINKSCPLCRLNSGVVIPSCVSPMQLRPKDQTSLAPGQPNQIKAAAIDQYFNEKHQQRQQCSYTTRNGRPWKSGRQYSLHDFRVENQHQEAYNNMNFAIDRARLDIIDNEYYNLSIMIDDLPIIEAERFHDLLPSMMSLEYEIEILKLYF